jgi:hypothetical protein
MRQPGVVNLDKCNIKLRTVTKLMLTANLCLKLVNDNSWNHYKNQKPREKKNRILNGMGLIIETKKDIVSTAINFIFHAQNIS